jgi:hypothetical protein
MSANDPETGSPVRGDETGLLLGSFGGTSDGGGIHHERRDITATRDKHKSSFFI